MELIRGWLRQRRRQKSEGVWEVSMKEKNHMKAINSIIITLLMFYSACKSDYRPAERVVDSTTLFSVEQLQSDYNQFRNHLESCHPKLYGFASKSSLDSMFDSHLALITDSMKIPEFYTLYTQSRKG
jgi:hypothetical protein